MGFEAFHISEPIAAALEQAGLRADQPRMAEIVPTAARENNLVVVAPPAAVHAMAGLAGILSGLGQHPEPGFLLILVHESALAEWERVTGYLASAAGIPFHAVRSITRAIRVVGQAGASPERSERVPDPSLPDLRVLISTPAAALTLMQRSALKAERLSSILLGFPEQWSSDPALPAIMQDVGEIQRVVYTAELGAVQDLVERYVRRGLTVPLPVPQALGRIRTVVTPWTRRQETAEAVIDLLDPASAVVWTRFAGAELGPAPIPGIDIVTTPPESAPLIIAWDLPEPADLVLLAAAGPVVLLVPPGTGGWVSHIAPESRALRLPSAADSVAAAAAAHRSTISAALESATLDGGLLALAPLFDQHDPATVAAALYQLWLEQPAPQAPAALPAGLEAATARLWLSVGKKDGAGPNDFVAMLTKDVGMERGKIGKVEVRELYSLVEVPAMEAESLVGKITGQSVRRRRITARIDRGGKPRGTTAPQR
ncbi:MAG: DbpA RNA binding domain-containing protein [Gemmatimonadota bacterium]